jgi:hypothetical protein
MKIIGANVALVLLVVLMVLTAGDIVVFELRRMRNARNRSMDHKRSASRRTLGATTN